MKLSPRAKGLLITFSGVALLIPDALTIRLSGLDPWSSVFWRSILASAVVLSVVLLLRRRQGIRSALTLSRSGVLLAGLITCGNIGFVMAMHLTQVANVLIIMALAPMFSALFDRLIYAKLLALRTWLAILCCLAGVSLLVADSLSSGSHSGNLVALLTAIVLGIELSLMGNVSERELWPALGLGYAGSAICASLLAVSLSLSEANLGAVLAMGLVIVPISFMLISQGPRYLPAPEVAMMMLLETVCGPLLVWWVIGEDPGRYALLGGAIVIFTLSWHSALDLLQERRQRRANG